MRRKVCRFCTDKIEIDYKNVSLLRALLLESGKYFQEMLQALVQNTRENFAKQLKEQEC
jgi:small subunit ribosomal protein S18